MGDWLRAAIGAGWHELVGDFPDGAQTGRMAVRLIAALILGGALGLERGLAGKAAGLRTHVLVTVGVALVMMAGELLKVAPADQTRVMQGILTGIGFIGAGAILKLSAERQIHGLTTAANIWLTAAIGISVGVGHLGLALCATLLALAVLAILGRWELRFGVDDDHQRL